MRLVWILAIWLALATANAVLGHVEPGQHENEGNDDEHDGNEVAKDYEGDAEEMGVAGELNSPIRAPHLVVKKWHSRQRRWWKKDSTQWDTHQQRRAEIEDAEELDAPKKTPKWEWRVTVHYRRRLWGKDPRSKGQKKTHADFE